MAKSKKSEIEPLDFLPEPKAFVDDLDKPVLLLPEDVENAKRLSQYVIRRAGTRLDRGRIGG